MGDHVYAALIAAGATILTALIGLVINRMEANDQRSRLLREVEVLRKLEQTDPAYWPMQDYVTQSVDALAESSRRHSRGVALTRMLWVLLLLSALAVLWMIEIDRFPDWHVAWLVASFPVAAVLVVMLAVEGWGIYRAEKSHTK